MNTRVLKWMLAVLILPALVCAWRAAPARAAAEKTVGGFPASWFFFGDQPAKRAALDELVGKLAPALDLQPGVGALSTPADRAGKILVVDIWATWCGPCLAAIPHNNELVKKYKDKGVLLVAVCSHSRGQEKLEDVAKEKGIEYPVSKDPGNKIAQAWHVSFYPTYAVVDQKGVLRAIGLSPANVDKVVDKLLEEAAAEKE